MIKTGFNQQHILMSKASYQQGSVAASLTIFLIAIVVVAGGALFLGHRIGFQQGQSALGTTTRAYADLKHENEQMTTQVNELKTQTSAAQQERDIVLSNLNTMREQISQLNVTNAQLRQTRDEYATIIANSGGVPLTLLAAKIKPLPEAAFEYQFDVLKIDQKQRQQTLKVTLMLENNGVIVKIPVEPSRYELNGIVPVRGRFTLPKGFKPKRAKLVLTAGNDNLIQWFNWRLGNKVSDMPLTLAEVPEVDKSPINPPSK